MTTAQKNLTIPIITISLMMAWALFPHNPYGYYVFLRLICSPLLLTLFFFSIAMIKFTRKAEYPNDLFGWPGFFVVFALLYNPLVQVHLTRGIWSVLNIATIILLAVFWLIRVRPFEGTLVFSEPPKPSTAPGKTLSDYDAAWELLNQAKG